LQQQYLRERQPLNALYSRMRTLSGRTAHLALQLFLLLFISASGRTQSRTDQPISASQAEQILVELRAIRQLLEHGSVAAATVPAEQHVAMLLRDAPALGQADAPLTLVEFTDYQCPYCRRFHLAAFEEIKKKLIETGKLRYVSVDLPLSTHQRAAEAAAAAHCAGEQQRFWEMRHVLIVNDQKLQDSDLAVYARDLHLDVGKFRQCLDQNRYADQVQRSFTDASQLGIFGTPSFVLGQTPKDDHFEGMKIVGDQPYQVFAERVRVASAR
jgi:protein-disulfide isomerase